MTNQHVLYRFFDSDGDLLYVGITMNPSARWPKHRRDKQWWSEVTDITLETYESRAEVLAAETEAIKTEHPRYNIAQSARQEEFVPPAPDKFIWHCVDCGFPIADEAGSLNIDLLAVQTYEQWTEDWLSSRGGTLEDFGGYPVRVPWQAQHADCVVEPDYLYAIPIHQMRTPSDVLARTAHLIGKTWLDTTNWEHILRAAAQGGR